MHPQQAGSCWHLIMKKVKRQRSRIHGKLGQALHFLMEKVKGGSRMRGKLAHAAHFLMKKAKSG